MERKIYVIIMAAGSGSRMGSQMPKQFIEIEGKAILQKTIEVFLDAFPDVSVITVLPEQYMEYWRNYCYRKNFTCPQFLVKGGITRFHSVRNALAKVPDGAIVAVHDGVRPLVSRKMLEEMFSQAAKVPALIPVVPCVDTMKALKKETLEDGSEILKPVDGMIVDRSVLYGAQTPQVFHSEILKEAYLQPFDTRFTDDASVVEKNSKNLSYVMGERFNIKITTQDDLILAEAILSVMNKD